MEIKAIHYGQLQLIPNIYCDAYILNDGTAVMSERGAADLLRVHQTSLKNMTGNWPPKTLKSFINSDLSMTVKNVVVDAENSHYKGRVICVYTAEMIENLIFGYALAFANGSLRPKQIHIGERAVILLRSLARTALEIVIKEVCGLTPQVQETVQRNYSAIDMIREAGFISSLNDDLAIKKDIVEFLRVPDATLNTFLRKHKNEIKPIVLDIETIRSIGCKANRMHAYSMENVAKIVFGMDTDITIQLKRNMFGEVATLSKPNAKDEIAWREFLTEVFSGFNLQFNAPLGRYRIDFLISDLRIALDYTQSNYPNET